MSETKKSGRKLDPNRKKSRIYDASLEELYTPEELRKYIKEEEQNKKAFIKTQQKLKSKQKITNKKCNKKIEKAKQKEKDICTLKMEEEQRRHRGVIYEQNILYNAKIRNINNKWRKKIQEQENSAKMARKRENKIHKKEIKELKKRDEQEIEQLKSYIELIEKNEKYDELDIQRKDKKINDLKKKLEKCSVEMELFNRLCKRRMSKEEFDSFVTRLNKMEVDWKEIGPTGLPEKQIREIEDKVKELKNELRRLDKEESQLKKQINMKKKLQTSLQTGARMPISKKEERAKELKRIKEEQQKAKMTKLKEKYQFMFEPAGANGDSKEKKKATDCEKIKIYAKKSHTSLKQAANTMGLDHKLKTCTQEENKCEKNARIIDKIEKILDINKLKF